MRKRKLAERLRAELKLLMARVCAHLMSGTRADSGTGGAGGGSSDGGECSGARRECPARDRMYACVLQARIALEATNSGAESSSSSTSAVKKTLASASASASRSDQTRDQSCAAQHL